MKKTIWGIWDLDLYMKISMNVSIYMYSRYFFGELELKQQTWDWIKLMIDSASSTWDFKPPGLTHWGMSTGQIASAIQLLWTYILKAYCHSMAVHHNLISISLLVIISHIQLYAIRLYLTCKWFGPHINVHGCKSQPMRTHYALYPNHSR